MLGVTFWVPTHAPNYLVTYFESVFAFLSHPAPGYPGRDLPLESYLSQRRLWGGRSTSRVKLPYTGAITMALKPPFPIVHQRRLPPTWRRLLSWRRLDLGDAFFLGDTFSWRRLTLLQTEKDKG